MNLYIELQATYGEEGLYIQAVETEHGQLIATWRASEEEIRAGIAEAKRAAKAELKSEAEEDTGF